MDVFLAKITNVTNVQKIDECQIFTHEDIYNFESDLVLDSFVFFVYGGDKSQITWEQGLVGFGKVVKAPYAKGYSSTNPRYFKIDVLPIVVLENPIPFRETKLDKKFQDDLYDVPYVGANHFPNQAIARAQGAGSVALFSIIYNRATDEQRELIPLDFVSSLLKNTKNKNSFSHALSKPFLLLAGISGTGKSRFVREQANRSSGEDAPSNYELISVRPDWHEPSDLLGYVSRLGDNAPHFVSTPTLKFMVSAWKNINPAAEELSANRFHNKDAVLPYWLCLDEMNLAPVEQYFADYLSVIETRDWTDGFYRCDPILKADVIKGLSDEGRITLKKDLGLETGFDALWDYFCAQGVPIPYNLIVAGTVNMDETTHGFSRKVIDRALTVDFGEFFPNDFDAFFDGSQKQPIVLSYPTGSEAREETDAAVKSRQFLKDLNESALKGTAFEVAFRALNELLLSVQSFAPYSDNDSAKLQAVWDDFLMMKVLPRIEGDRDKVEQVLEKLKEALTKQLNDIWLDEPKRLDLWRDTKDPILCRSKVKIKWMQDRLEKSGFTSFWP